ncbi:orotidine-5'-phosphate decarboxylase [Frankia sp. QA3]|uniref:orotidine-5'-phosphate decarboxylase n=1 Tax=Frankia sp. QA3 TaxID=710111 RepID=UPI000269CFF6|nr:orotidine-5'-phosphate decarboxylase [Frankia sp. QA3]EIV96406.1 orotidine 5''-phosphate decarboxylase, subfamily 1 [Frankia sp. QA3]
MSAASRFAPRAGRAPLAVALDAPDGATALRWAEAVAPHAAVLKIGLELFYREGPAVVTALRAAGLLAEPGAGGAAPGEPSGVAPELFVDLKLHDIPATVAGGMRSVATLQPRFVTVHAAGGAAMIRAAVAAAPAVEVAVVTVLTSLDAAALAAVGLAGPPDDAVRRLAVLAVEAGARTLVCSPREVRMVRSELGDNVTLITPGVRPEGSEVADQARIATPREALEAGADLVVVGRPITRATDLGVMAKTVADSISAGQRPAGR